MKGMKLNGVLRGSEMSNYGFRLDSVSYSKLVAHFGKGHYLLEES